VTITKLGSFCNGVGGHYKTGGVSVRAITKLGSYCNGVEAITKLLGKL